MRTTKPLLTLAIMLALPFGAMAEDWSAGTFTYHPVQTPESVHYNGTTNITNFDAPYAVMNIDTSDSEHIASTAYVKGAYNDAIAAMNRIDYYKLDKATLHNTDVDDDLTGFVGTDTMLEALASVDDLSEDDWYEYELKLVSLAGVLKGINSKRVEIYTTWDDDTAKQQVAFVSASGQQ